MRMTAPTCAFVLVILSLSAGCRGKNPAAPTAAPGPPPPTSENLTNALSLTDFSLTGWHDGTFHYLPTVSVSAPSTGGTVYVQRVAFMTSTSGAPTNLAGILFGSPRRVVSPGGTLDLLKGVSPVEITSPVALASITATVSFNNEVGQTGTVAVTEDAPPLAPNSSSAALVIQAFSVIGSSDQGDFHYWPKLTLTETSGVSRALIKKMTFELLDVGPNGRVPTVWEPHEIPAGGTITLENDDYGYGPWFEITSVADVQRVSLAISFVDDAGRGALVTAVVPVSR
jgi:hypothetical protein